MQRLKSMWARIKEYNSNRLITTIHKMSAEEYSLQAQAAFDAAKKLSDFIGMIVRLAFVQGAASYFYHKSQASGGILGFVYGFCLISVFSLGIALGVRIMFVVLYHEANAARSEAKAWPKWVLYVFAICNTLILFYGIHSLVIDLARSATPK